MVGCTNGSRGDVPGERKPEIRDDEDDDDIITHTLQHKHDETIRQRMVTKLEQNARSDKN
jgi:hypothetical protein